nr:hypothetical protein [uncultured Cohaesibacter sp.]
MEMAEEIQTLPNYITLATAAKLLGRKTQTLRNERDKGNLVCYRMGGVDYTTYQNIKDMFELCRVEPNPRASFSGRDKVVRRSMSSSTEATRQARATALNAAKKLKSS